MYSYVKHTCVGETEHYKTQNRWLGKSQVTLNSCSVILVLDTAAQYTFHKLYTGLYTMALLDNTRNQHTHHKNSSINIINISGNVFGTLL